MHATRSIFAAVVLGVAIAAVASAPAAGRLIPVTAPELIAAVRQQRARVVLVNVWATWCEPCREEFPDLLRLQKAYADRGVRLVLVSSDFRENEPGALRFLGAQGAAPPFYVKSGGDAPFIDGLDPGWSGALPASFVFDGAGHRVASWEGRLPYAVMEQKIRAALESSS